jgi:hypothetical protein
VKEAILKRYPELKEEDVFLQDDGDGKGPRLVTWNSDKPIPTMEQVYQWVEEDQNIPAPKSELEIIKENQEVIQKALDELILGGML